MKNQTLLSSLKRAKNAYTRANELVKRDYIGERKISELYHELKVTNKHLTTYELLTNLRHNLMVGKERCTTMTYFAYEDINEIKIYRIVWEDEKKPSTQYVRTIQRNSK